MRDYKKKTCEMLLVRLKAIYGWLIDMNGVCRIEPGIQMHPIGDRYILKICVATVP